MTMNKDEHFDLFTKPKYHEVRAGVGSENSGLYKKYVPVPRNLDILVEYFVFEERKRQGFSSPFLKKNPFEDSFADFIEDFELKHKNLPKEIAHARLLSALEVKHKEALASLK